MEDKKIYTPGLLFRSQLDLAGEESEDGVQANIQLGQIYEGCANTHDSEKREESLSQAANYYVKALTLAKALNLPDYIKKAQELLKSIGSNEVGEVIASNEVNTTSVPGASLT